MMEFWKRKTIYRKILLIAMALHLLGCFVFPFVKLHASASALNDMMSYFSLGELPEKMTLITLIGFLNDRGSSDGMAFTAILVFNVIALVIHLIGKKRGSYVFSLLLWMASAGLEAFIPEVTFQLRRFAYESSGWGNLLYILCAVNVVVSILGILFEMKAQAGGSGKIQFQVDPEKMEKLKKQAGNVAGVAAAVAKHTAKTAAKELPKVTGVVKEFVENAKKEEGVPAGQPKAEQPAPAVQPVKKPIPQTGSITGIKGMFAGAQIPMESGETIVIGRGAEICHIILDGAVISRKHCEVRYDGTTGNYIVTDFSENGTYVGSGEKLPGGRGIALSPGTVISIGNDENTFQLG